MHICTYTRRNAYLHMYISSPTREFPFCSVHMMWVVFCRIVQSHLLLRQYPKDENCFNQAIFVLKQGSVRLCFSHGGPF